MECLIVLLLKIVLAYCSIFLVLLLGAAYKADDDEDDVDSDPIESDPEYSVNFFTGEQDSGLNPNGSYK